MVVIVIIGSMMTLGYQVLKSVLRQQYGQKSPLQLESLFKQAREQAMSQNQTLTLHLNRDSNTMGLAIFDPQHENSEDKALAELAIKKDRHKALREKMNEQQLEDDKEEQLTPDWLMGPEKLPPDLTTLYSTSGLELTAYIIYVHFYPDGSADPLILHFEDRTPPYMIVPRQNLPVVYTDNLAIDRAIPNEENTDKFTDFE